MRLRCIFRKVSRVHDRLERHSLVMRVWRCVEAEIEFFASLVKVDGWLKGDHIDLGLYLIRKRQQELEEVEISDWTTIDVFFMVPACGMDWQNAYKVYAPYEILKEEITLLSITIPNLLNTIDFYEEGVYANDCSQWCSWPIERVDVPQQSNQ
ncbi:hypothetical protein L3X38_000371 [Prunus dulcis]|uniref:Uncharacterized protein n=1 Tax=Prunus dulcis TaxID=3755 RepID=A0AAD4URZ9_PRUDU|nr:hypothetical protein L3X38_000371 [Prunus dulcis]